MDEKIINEMGDGVKKYKQYFEEDLTAIEEELEKSKEYSTIIDNEINSLKVSNPLGASKGSQRYLVDHITNAVALQTQRQGLRRDRFTIKKAILDYASKEIKEGGENQDIMKTIEDIVSGKIPLPTTSIVEATDDEIDNAVDSALDNFIPST